MKSFFAVAVLIVFFTGLAIAQPKLVIEGGDTVNWGKVKNPDVPLKKVVKLWNKGKKDTLRIYNVKPGCGCTTAPLDKDKIAPNQFATLDITFNVQGNKGDVHKSIAISTNDPDRRHADLHLVANVSEPLSLFPKYLTFLNSFVGVNDSAKVVLSNNSDVDIRIEEVSVEPADFKVSVKKGTVVPKQGMITIMGYFKPGTYGRFTGKINLKTNFPDIPRYTISIHGFAREKQ